MLRFFKVFLRNGVLVGLLRRRSYVYENGLEEGILERRSSMCKSWEGKRVVVEKVGRLGVGYRESR